MKKDDKVKITASKSELISDGVLEYSAVQILEDRAGYVYVPSSKRSLIRTAHGLWEIDNKYLELQK